jgi:Kdo2-lipid IVA lauroyltransferase/acyltransferase
MILRRLLGICRILSPGCAWWLGGVLGHAFGGLPLRDQRRCRAHLAKAFPEHSPAWVAGTARRCFRHVGRMALWTLATLDRDPGRLRRGIGVADPDHLRDLMRAARHGRATVVYTGHLGNWELLARIGGTLVPLAAVGRRLRNPKADALVQALRSGGGTQVLYQHEDVRVMLRTLRAGRSLAVLTDQDLPRLAGTWVPWFGDWARTPTGPAGLVQMAGGACQSGFLLWHRGRGPVGGGRWVLHLSPRQIYPRTADRDAQQWEITARTTAFQMELVKLHPEQWVWWHLRWRTRPPSNWTPSSAAVDVFGAGMREQAAV